MRIEETGHIGRALVCAAITPRDVGRGRAEPPALVREADRCELGSGEFVPEFWAMLSRENKRMAALRHAEFVERSALKREPGRDAAASAPVADAASGARPTLPDYAGARIGDVSESVPARTAARVDAVYQREVVESAGNIVNVLI